jgi:hypothetical protein
MPISIVELLDVSMTLRLSIWKMGWRLLGHPRDLLLPLISQQCKERVSR